MDYIEYTLSKEDLELINEVEESDMKKENNIYSNRIKKEDTNDGNLRKANIKNSSTSDKTQGPTSEKFQKDSMKSISKVQRDEISKFEPTTNVKTEFSIKNKQSQKMSVSEKNINQFIEQSFEKVKIFEPGFKHPTKEGVKCRRIYEIIPDLSNLSFK